MPEALAALALVARTLRSPDVHARLRVAKAVSEVLSAMT